MGNPHIYLGLRDKLLQKNRLSSENLKDEEYITRSSSNVTRIPPAWRIPFPAHSFQGRNLAEVSLGPLCGGEGLFTANERMSIQDAGKAGGAGGALPPK